jgi:hypothetical protein
MSLKTTIKRVNLFSQGQRLIVIISSAIAILAMAILYYTPFPIVIFPVVILLNYLLFRRILVTKKMKTIFTKSLKPMIWVLTGFFYFYSVYVISQTPIVIFALCIALTSLIYGLLCYLEIQPEPNIILDNVITIFFILIVTSLASLSVAFWKWPIALVMLILWIVNFLIALWWLLDFTNKPQILAALWGFVTLEIFWLASRWAVLYQIPAIPFIISQYSAIITALAYGWGGIYYHYKHKNLKKAIVAEYLAVTIVVFVALIVLNRWTSTG